MFRPPAPSRVLLSNILGRYDFSKPIVSVFFNLLQNEVLWPHCVKSGEKKNKQEKSWSKCQKKRERKKYHGIRFYRTDILFCGYHFTFWRRRKTPEIFFFKRQRKCLLSKNAETRSVIITFFGVRYFWHFSHNYPIHYGSSVELPKEEKSHSTLQACSEFSINLFFKVHFHSSPQVARCLLIILWKTFCKLQLFLRFIFSVLIHATSKFSQFLVKEIRWRTLWRLKKMWIY